MSEDLLKTATRIEIKAEPLPKKPKRPRSEAQIAATLKMREALAAANEKGIQRKAPIHTMQYEKKQEEAEEKATKIREKAPQAKVVVTAAVGRPRGSRTRREAPTPAVESDEEYPPQSRQEAIRQVREVLQDPMRAYLSSLNH